MKFNGATFNKAQQDQLKKKVGAELDDVIKKVDEVDSRMLNYTGDWVTDNEYHENDVVTWTHDGHLYEVIKAHTSSSTINPSNTEYYKAMTARKSENITLGYNVDITAELLTKLADAQNEGKQIIVNLPTPNIQIKMLPSVNSYYIYGYTTIIDNADTSFKEYILTGERNSRIKVYFRNVSLSNPSSAPAFSVSSLSGQITFIIGL